jgi:hypothetical protein
VALPAQSADLEFQPDDLVCAFYNGDGSQLNDLAVDFISQGLRAGNNKILVNGPIIENPYYVPKQQFLSS